MGALTEYLNDTAQLLLDPNFTFTTQTQMMRWINQARREAVERSGCVRRLISGQPAFGAVSTPGFFTPGAAQPGSLPGIVIGAASGGVGGGFSSGFSSGFSTGSNSINLGVPGLNGCQTIIGVERYPFQGFFNLFLKQQYADSSYVLDAATLSVNWGGVNRPNLDWMPWDDFQAYCRAYAVLNTSYPSVWTVYNDGAFGEIFMFPIPSTQGEIELDAFVMPIDLVSDSDPEAIPSGFRRAIKYGAAKLVYLSTGRFAQADVMEDSFSSALGVSRVSADRGKVPSWYWKS